MSLIYRTSFHCICYNLCLDGKTPVVCTLLFFNYTRGLLFNKHRIRDEVIISHHLKLFNHNFFLVYQFWNKNNHFNHLVFVHFYFSIISCAEVLNLILVFLEVTDSLYPHIQCLVVELNSNTHTVFITYMCFVMISCWVPHISPSLYGVYYIKIHL